MQKKAIFFAGVLLCLLILAAVGFYWYQKPRAGVENEDAVYRFKATELYQSFQQDEKKADRQYSGKVLEVSGTVDNVEHIYMPSLPAGRSTCLRRWRCRTSRPICG